MSKLTPMMQQYMSIKEKANDSILFYRLGDFYEMFFEDAKVASKELELTLTGRDCGLEERAPMCGVPHHAAQGYIKKLIEKGYKVAICEQTQDPSQAKGIVTRDIVRVVTPGTIIESNLLEEKSNNFLAAVYQDGNMFALSYVDISTGLFKTTQILYGDARTQIIDEIARLQPKELIFYLECDFKDSFIKEVLNRTDAYITQINIDKDLVRAHKTIKSHFGECEVLSPQFELALLSCDLLFGYLNETQKQTIGNIDQISFYQLDHFMILDANSRRNLELTKTMREGKKKGSLLWVLDKTVTSMGGRKLKQLISQPLIHIHDINYRLDAIEYLYNDYILCNDLVDSIDGIYDIERILSRLALGNITLRDLASLRISLKRLPTLKSLLADSTVEALMNSYNDIDTLDDIYQLIEDAIVDDPPVNTKDGGYIKKGFKKEIDELIEIKQDGTKWLKALEEEERTKTGIKNLKIKYNKVFGYFMDVTKSYLDLVPETYIRKQTLANSERYISKELKVLEEKILTADEKLKKLELTALNQVKETLSNALCRMKKTADVIATIDVFCSLTKVSIENEYVRPKITLKDEIRIKNGRHPVVEMMLPVGDFIPNDAYLDLNNSRIAIITGPNMAGKSTFMRQTALIVLMAQMGCFVPCEEAEIGLADRIFTRVGASDDLGSGQSTFMVEMTEVANILNNATSRSLLILDEIGRGTSTFDGLGIAWAVTEYISNKNLVGARTLFATHYHELTELEGKVSGVRNYCVDVLDKGEDITFLRKIIKGGVNDSYGIHVAKLAGVPQKVLDRASELVKEFKDLDKKRYKGRKNIQNGIDGQLDIFTLANATQTIKEKDIAFKDELRKIEISKVTPMEALNILYELQKKYLKG